MNNTLKSFFMFISTALVLLFLSSSAITYYYFNLSSLIPPAKQSDLVVVVIIVLFFIILILYLFALKFVIPVLTLNRISLANKDEYEHEDYKFFFQDEISFMGRHLVNIRNELKEDTTALQALSLMDPLTRINNRRYFVEFGEKIFKLAKRNKENISLIMFEINHLDITHSKQSHDKNILLLSEVIDHSIRKSDVFARYSEELFVLLLPQTNEVEAQVIIKKVEDSLSHPKIKNRVDACFSIIIGVSSREDEDVFLRDITQRADYNLAKDYIHPRS